MLRMSKLPEPEKKSTKINVDGPKAVLLVNDKHFWLVRLLSTVKQILLRLKYFNILAARKWENEESSKRSRFKKIKEMRTKTILRKA